MKQRTFSLLFKFTFIFGIFTLITIALNSLATYASQIKAYEKQCEQNIRNIGGYLERLIVEQGDSFQFYQDYYMAHYAEIDIPYDFAEYKTALSAFEELYVKEFEDEEEVRLPFTSFSEELQKAYFVFMHEYWLLKFEEVRDAFHLPYTYYLVPKEKEFKMVYMIDGERSHKGSDGQKAESGDTLYLGDEYYNDPKVYTVEWDAWFTGKKPEGYQVWNNAWGHTYAYYTPVVINGKKLGLIGTEINVADVKSEILRNTLPQSIGMGFMLIVCFVLLLLLLNKKYISKIGWLENVLGEYVVQKKPEIATKIEDGVKGNDEIASLARKFAAMILEIESYMQRLFSTAQELKDTQSRADAMNELANKDALTGIRNKTAYDAEMQRLEKQLESGSAAFGIAMIDLNFLKIINDSYGHDMGNYALKKLCYIVCHVFKHSPVFRIGGDEFVVIFENVDYDNADLLIANFEAQLAVLATDTALHPWERVSAALGFARFDKTIDANVSSVFKRADKAMYVRKRQMKAVREI